MSSREMLQAERERARQRVAALEREFAGLAEPTADEQTLDRMPGTELEDTRPRGRS